MKDKVFQIVKSIPKGCVLTYKDIGLILHSKAYRAIGNILHSNKEEFAIPCYKIVNSQGKLSLNYAFGGREKQKEKLEKDGIEVINYTVDLNKYRFNIDDLILK